MSRLRACACIALLIAMSGCAHVQGDARMPASIPVQPWFELQRVEDSAMLRALEPGWALEVTNDSGIGRVQLRVADRQPLQLRLRRAPGVAYAGLEGLLVDGQRIDASTARVREGWLQVSLPALAYDGETHVVQWIDHY